MADLVAEVSQDRAIRLVHLVPPLLPLGIVGLGRVDRDHSVLHARKDLDRTRGAGR